MTPDEAMLEALLELVGEGDLVELSAANVRDLLGETEVRVEMAEAAGYGTAAEARAQGAEAVRQRRSFMRRLQRYSTGAGERRTPDRATVELLNTLYGQIRPGGLKAVVEAIIREGVTVIGAGSTSLTIRVRSPRRRGRQGSAPDVRQRPRVPTVYVSAELLAKHGFPGSARRAINSDEWEHAADRLFGAWLEAYGVGGPADVSEVDQLVLRIGRVGAPEYGAA